MEASSRASWQGLLPAPDSGAINKARGNDLVGGAVWQSGGGGTGEDAPGVQVCISAPNVTNRATHNRKRPCMSQSFTLPCKPPNLPFSSFFLPPWPFTASYINTEDGRPYHWHTTPVTATSLCVMAPYRPASLSCIYHSLLFSAFSLSPAPHLSFPVSVHLFPSTPFPHPCHATPLCVFHL